MNENLGRLYNKLVEMISTGQYKSKQQLIVSLNLIKEDSEFSSKYGINNLDFETCIPLLLDLYDRTSSKETPSETIKNEEPVNKPEAVNGLVINNLGQYETEYLLKNEKDKLTPGQIKSLEERFEMFNTSEKELKLEQNPKIKLLKPNSNNFKKTAFIDLLILSILSFGFSLGVLVYILYQASI